MLALSLSRQKIEKASKEEFYVALHRIADKAEPQIRKQIIDTFSKIRSETKLQALANALGNNDEAKVFEILGLDDLRFRMNESALKIRGIIEESGSIASSLLPNRVQTGMVFDLLNPRSVEFIQQYTGDLITAISNTTKEAVREIVREGFEVGLAPVKQAQKIKDIVGLTARQAKVVDNYRKLLESEGVKPAVVERRVAAYNARQLRYRAKMIARTETIRAANAGQQIAWEQAAEQGLIDPHAVTKKWVITPDDRLCERCKSVAANNKSVGLYEAFQTDVGPLSQPPLHVFCRCASSLNFGK